MPTHGPDLSKLSISQLAELSGHDRRTVRKRLGGLEPLTKDSRTLWYSARAALEAIFVGEALDLSRERARLARAQSESQERKNQIAVGEWVERETVDRVLVALMIGTRDKMLAIPHKLAPRLAADSTTTGCGVMVDAEIREALHELADEGQQAAERLERDRRRRSRAARANGAAS